MEHEFQVFIDPYRGRIVGEREYGKTFWGLMFDLHRTLLAGEAGRRIVGGHDDPAARLSDERPVSLVAAPTCPPGIESYGHMARQLERLTFEAHSVLVSASVPVSAVTGFFT